MPIDITSAMTPAPTEQQSEYSQKDMAGHSEMMCQVLMQLGRIDAKIDMMMAEDAKEDSKESESGDMASSIIKAVESGMPGY